MRWAILFCLFFTGLRLEGDDSVNQTSLMVLDPGHFHAALVMKEMYPWLSPRISVYAPLGADVLDYLNRVTLFNTRKDNPTSWQVELHTGPDFLERMLAEHPGNVVILAGRNRPKIERIRASVEAGLNVLADKPWIITSADLPTLERILNETEARHLVAYDIMTERYEITSILQRELVNDEDVFGRLVEGTGAETAISAKSVHHLMKTVAGTPLRRPAWFFDIGETGEGLADVGTHVVDLVQWTAFAGQKLDWQTDIRILSGKRWPTVMSKADFQNVTGEPDFPAYLSAHLRGGSLEYYCNNSVHYTVKGAHVKLDIRWNWEAPAGAGDSYEAAFRGTRARIELRQGQEQKYVPELYVAPVSGSVQAEVAAALKRKIAALQSRYPGLDMEGSAATAHIVIPEKYRVGHEAHFAQVTNQFFEYLKASDKTPAWEKSNMLVKYYVSTKGVEAAR